MVASGAGGLDEMYELKSEQHLPAPIDRVFEFFADPSNLDRLTPDRLQFEITTDLPVEMGEGVELDYRLRIHGVPISWKSLIEVWKPPEKFVDLQIQGPYTHWRHEHLFEETEEGTLVTDRVRYEVPGWIFSPLVHALFVRPDIESIFAYRREQLDRLFGS